MNKPRQWDKVCVLTALHLAETRVYVNKLMCFSMVSTETIRIGGKYKQNKKGEWPIPGHIKEVLTEIAAELLWKVTMEESLCGNIKKWICGEK